MNTEQHTNKTPEENNLALIIPQYTYDAKSLQLLRTTNNEEFNKIINRVSFKNNGYSIMDADSQDLQTPIDENNKDKSNSSPNFIGNARTLVKLYTALYENQSFSQVMFI